MQKIKKALKGWIQYFGFFPDKKVKPPHNYNPADYINTRDETLQVHKEYLEAIQEEERDRLETIENKTSTLVSQTGIIFSLLSLFIPIFIDKAEGLQPLVRVMFFGLLICAFLFYMLTIKNAVRNFNIKNFSYVKFSPNSVMSKQSASKGDFKKEVVQDLLYATNMNVAINNKKASNLIFSYRAFKVANTFTGCLVVGICFSFLFSNSVNKSVTLENPIIIQNADFDSLLGTRQFYLNHKATPEVVEILQNRKKDSTSSRGANIKKH